MGTLSRNSKKAREHLQFEIFREVCGNAPAGTACAQECPDFLVRQQGGYLGIELTQYFKPAVAGRRPIQEQHSLQAMIVERAQRSYEAKTGIPLRVYVLFRARTDLNKRQATELASALAAFVDGCPITDLHTRFDPWNARPELRSVTAVYAHKCTGGLRSLWRLATAGAVRPLTPDDVRGVIASKESDIATYDDRTSENWLIIVLDGSAASFAVLTEEARTATYQTAFTRVHFLDIAEGTCTDLRVAAA
jgi:hypothetical protein